MAKMELEDSDIAAQLKEIDVAREEFSRGLFGQRDSVSFSELASALRGKLGTGCEENIAALEGFFLPAITWRMFREITQRFGDFFSGPGPSQLAVLSEFADGVRGRWLTFDVSAAQEVMAHCGHPGAFVIVVSNMPSGFPFRLIFTTRSGAARSVRIKRLSYKQVQRRLLVTIGHVQFWSKTLGEMVSTLQRDGNLTVPVVALH